MEPEAMPEDASGIAIVSKSDAVLTALSGSGELTANELALAVDEPLSSMYRLLKSLENIGWVSRTGGRGKFRLGLHFIGLAAATSARLDLRRIALPYMEQLRTSTGETPFLCIRRGLQAVCIERIDGAEVQSLALSVGEALPLHRGAAPRAILAYESPAVTEGILESDGMGSSKESADDLRAGLQEIRRTGISISDGDVTPGIAAVGAAIFNHRDVCIAALSVAGRRDRVLGQLAATDVREEVRAAAIKISSDLGWRHAPVSPAKNAVA
jgi:DNA-binding IclR family transcriptional regulator